MPFANLSVLLTLTLFLTGWFVPAASTDAQEPNATATQAPQTPEQLTEANLDGTWSYVSGSSGGAKIDPDRLADQRVVFSKNTLTLKSTAGDFVMDYQIDTKQTPATLKCKITASPFGEGATINGIIQLDEGELTICYAHEGDAPVKFTSEQNVNHRLLVLKREAAE